MLQNDFLDSGAPCVCFYLRFSASNDQDAAADID
jgi:hypothetical protein